MAREPSYPDDMPVGGKSAPAPAPKPSAAAAGPETASEAGAAAKAVDPRRKQQLVAGAAIGIGSAAIVAALLYANRSRRNDRS
jgi:hypothetical protein